MAHVLIVDPVRMKRAAASVQGLHAGVKSDFPDVHDCGSALVADTLDFFVDLLTRSLTKNEKKAELLATAIIDTADDFTSIEEGNLETVQNLADALRDLVSDE